MTTMKYFAHECRMALQDAGMVHDGVTGSKEDWERNAEAIIAEHIYRVIRDAKEAESGR